MLIFTLNTLLKQCTKCKQEKQLSEFYKDKSKKSGYSSYCKACQKVYDDSRKNDEERNKRKREQRKQYYKNNKEKEDKRNSEYYYKHKEQCLEVSKQYYKNNHERCLKQAKQYRINNPDKLKEQQEKVREYRQKHLTEVRIKANKYRQDNRERILQLRQQPERKLANNISAAIYYALKGNKQGLHWEDLVGYNLQQLKEHLESQFTPEMSWDNYGKYWEIDHIIPINTFNLTSFNESKFKICWSLANLRPLEKLLNRSRPKNGSDISEKLKQQILGQNL